MMGSPTPSQLSTFGNKLDPVSLYGHPTFSMQQRNMSGVLSNNSFQSTGNGAANNITNMMGSVNLGGIGGGLMSGYSLGSNGLQQQQQRLTQQARPPQSISPNKNMFNMNQNLLAQLSAAQAGLNQKNRTSNNLLPPSGLSSGVTQGSNFSRTIGNTPAGLDWSDFPTLGSRNSQQNQLLTARNYVGMVSKPQPDTTPEFQIQQEDFPALPGAQNPLSSSASDISLSKPSANVMGSYDQALKDNGVIGSGVAVGSSRVLSDKQQQPIGSQQQLRRTLTDGTVGSISSTMVSDQFGIAGLLNFMRSAEADPNLVALAPGMDLTTLGLNLNSSESLYSTFHTPWSESPIRAQDMDYHVPLEYLTNCYIRDTLAPIKFNRYQEDLLFYLFYANSGDILQIAAAAELYNRDWRYHKEERVWLTRAPGMEPQTKSTHFERGTYVVFDVLSWRKIPREFHLEYSKLEEKPQLPEMHPLYHKNISTNN